MSIKSLTIFFLITTIIYSCSYDSANELFHIDKKTKLDTTLVIDTIKTDSTITIDTTIVIDTVPLINCDTVSFSNHIFPFIETNCLISTCHDGSDGAIKLTSRARLSVYSDVIIKAINHERGTTPMPRNPDTFKAAPKLSDEKIAVFECWVETGKQDN